MSKRFYFQLLLPLCFIAITCQAQNGQPNSLNIGDPAPPLRVREWLKGTSIEQFEKGTVYVLEFWATWCRPCKAAIPHLSILAGEYKDRVTILGIDVYENKSTSIEKVKAFVDSMGTRMDYHVAADDSNFMVAGWLNASGEQGIPQSFVVNAEGKVAWIGHPKDLGKVLPDIVNNTWDIKEVLARRNFDKHLKKLDNEASYQLPLYLGDPEKRGDLGKPEWALLVINEITTKEPKLKYAPFIASHTFSSLLKTNLHEAYEYGKVAIVTSTYAYEVPAYDPIIADIKWYSDKLNLPAEIYWLGTQACQASIDQITYPEIENPSRIYKQMAEWFWRINDKSKAIEAQQKAVEALKSKEEFSVSEMAAFEFQLQEYKKM